jgi:RNA polymerase sigma factor (sigma-70 family)
VDEDLSKTVEPSLVSEIHSSRQQFLALVADLRPDLHRYCARMTGSVSDGEDIVQETLARAYYALPELHSLPPLRSWLFRIAHNAALDHLRRYDRRMGRPLDEVAEPADDTLGADDELSAREAVQAAVTRFLQLPASQRSCVVLKDVLGHSVDEIAVLVGLSVPAVKAALNRGRQTLRKTGETAREATASAPSTTSPEIVRYVALFNAHDWDGVRAMLAEEVRLDLVTRSRRNGRQEVGGYFGNYEKFGGWYLVPAWLEGHEVVAVFPSETEPLPAYFIELAFSEGRLASIKDFRYVPYIAADARLVCPRPTPAP